MTTKRRAMLLLLETPGPVLVHAFVTGVTGVDAKHFDGPRDAATGELLVEGMRIVGLNFSPKFGPTLTLDEAGIHQVLSFEGTSSPVFVPWESVFTLSRDEIHIVFPIVAQELKPEPVKRHGLKLV